VHRQADVSDGGVDCLGVVRATGKTLLSLADRRDCQILKICGNSDLFFTHSFS